MQALCMHARATAGAEYAAPAPLPMRCLASSELEVGLAQLPDALVDVLIGVDEHARPGGGEQ
jgi:hypothetical protein